jgi:hypothetical protein
MNRIFTALSTHKCHGCTDVSVHDSHLTWLGRLRYTGTLHRV